MQSMFDCDRQAATFLPVILHRGHWLRGGMTQFSVVSVGGVTRLKTPRQQRARGPVNLSRWKRFLKKKRENKSNLK